MDQRLHDLHQWLKETYPDTSFTLQPMQGDASFRRYFRFREGTASYVVMDAPPERETCAPFMAIAKALRARALKAPDILQADPSKGFLLMTDFGDRTLLKALNSTNAEILYQSALSALNVLSQCDRVPGWTVPPFTAFFMRQELELFKDWFLQKYLEMTLSPTIEKTLTDCFVFLAETAAQQPQVFMHRDYHSANLMVLENNQIGILDFQDAFQGPLMYDIVSLLRDCYIAWPDDFIHRLVLSYQSSLSLPVSRDLFLRWFDLMGMQRHLKTLLTFSRKHLRDQNPHYLQHVPRTLNYIQTVSERYPECQAFYHFLCDEIMPAYQRVTASCAE